MTDCHFCQMPFETKDLFVWYLPPVATATPGLFTSKKVPICGSCRTKKLEEQKGA
jgi:hypothetical protein